MALKSGKSGKYSRNVKSWLGQDSTYQGQLREFNRALGNMSADVGRQRNRTKSAYNRSTRALSRQRKYDLQDITSDYAGRGILRSGLYATNRGRYEQEYGERRTDLRTQRTQTLNDLNTQLKRFKSQRQIDIQAARAAAIRRRAERYGLT